MKRTFIMYRSHPLCAQPSPSMLFQPLMAPNSASVPGVQSNPLPPSEREVYLAFRCDFASVACPKSLKKIQSRVLRHAKTVEVQALLNQYDTRLVTLVVQTLANAGIFESVVKAHARFAGLPDIPNIRPKLNPVVPVPRAADTAQEEPGERDPKLDACVDAKRSTLSPCERRRAQAPPVLGTRALHAQVGDGPSVKTPLPSNSYKAVSIPGESSDTPDTVYLPLTSQHHLLSQVQKELERTCFAFAQRSLPELLAAEKWTCAEAAELNIWTNKLPAYAHGFAAEALARLARPYSEVLASLARLRHTAVHRLQVPVEKVEQFVADAEALVGLMGPEGREAVDRLKWTRRRTQLAVQEARLGQDRLERRRATVREEFVWRRTQLGCLERAKFDRIAAEDQEEGRLASGLFIRDLKEGWNFMETDKVERGTDKAGADCLRMDSLVEMGYLGVWKGWRAAIATWAGIRKFLLSR